MEKRDLALNEKNITAAPDYIKLFAMAIEDIGKSLKNAAMIYAGAIKKYPDAKKKFEEYFPRMAGTFARFEAIAQGTIREDVFYLTGEVGDKIRRLPLSSQNDIMERGVPLLTANGDHLMISADAITALQARQLIAPDGTLRTLAQQKAWLESQKTRALRTPVRVSEQTVLRGPAYEVRDGKLVVYREIALDRKQLFEILGKMI